jgi:hypothetical protein
VREKVIPHARYLVEEAVLAALARKTPTPQVEMGGHLLAWKVLKNFEGQVGIPTHDGGHARKVKRRG